MTPLEGSSDAHGRTEEAFRPVPAVPTPDEASAHDITIVHNVDQTSSQSAAEISATDPAADAAIDIRAGLEALLVVVEGALSLSVAARALGRSEAELDAMLESLAEEYQGSGRGFRLRRGPEGWRLYAAPEYKDLIERAVVDEQPSRLTQAALDTLAVVAYQQPVARSRVAAVRGVSVDAVMRTLVGRGLVTEVGQDPASGAVLYGTTMLFLEKVGITDLGRLPELAPLLPDIESVIGFDGGLSS